MSNKVLSPRQKIGSVVILQKHSIVKTNSLDFVKQLDLLRSKIDSGEQEEHEISLLVHR